VTTVDGRPPAPTVTVVPMRRRHLDEVLAIETAAYPRPWSARLFEDELDRSRRLYLVARVGPTVVGYTGLLMIADDGHVATVAVDEGWQSRGVATRLLLALVRGAVDLGANQLTLEVRMSNQRAQNLYRRFGFAPAGARKAYYGDNGEDALVMWAHDVTEAAYADRLAHIDADLAGATTFAVAASGTTAPVHPAAGAAS
jgi:ribosomal-protein-alanine N-acetyltransferase